MIKVSNKDALSKLNRSKQIMESLPENALAEFKRNTPIDSGNARRNTYLSSNTIVAEYPYAQRLEDNWSKQTQGRGMVNPTIEWIEKEIERRLRSI